MVKKKETQNHGKYNLKIYINFHSLRKTSFKKETENPPSISL